MEYLLLLLGLSLLVGSGDFLVKGAVGIAYKFKLSPLVIGMTVVSFGTSIPELLVSVEAALGGHPDISIGNVVGSNIANLALVLGVTAIIFPIVVSKFTVRIDWPVLLGATLLVFYFMSDGLISSVEAIILLLYLVVYIFGVIRFSNKPLGDDDEVPDSINIRKSIIFVVISCVGLAIGSKLLLDNAILIAQNFGVSERIIAITVVAFGTSVPELVTSCIAAYRKHTDILVGNLIGSNLFNITAILGVTGLITEIPVSAQTISLDMWIVLGVLLLLFPLMRYKYKIYRWMGVLLVGVYLGYIAYIW